MEGIVGIIGEKAGGIIGAILAIIDALGEDPAAFVDQILDKVASVIEAVISQIPEIIANVVSGAANIVGSVFEGIGNLFGLGGDNSAFEAAVDKWGWLLDSWKDNLEYEKELIEKAYGGDVLSIAGQSKEMLEKTMQAAREVYEGWAGSGAGLFSHSNGYEANRDAAWRYLFQSNPEIAKKLGISQIKINAGFGDMEFYDGEDISKLFGLDWKELEKLKHENSQFWQSLYEEARNYLDQYIEAGKAIEEMESQLNEKLTTTTKEGVFDDFLEQLYNLADGSETVFDDRRVNMEACSDTRRSGTSSRLHTTRACLEKAIRQGLTRSAESITAWLRMPRSRLRTCVTWESFRLRRTQPTSRSRAARASLPCLRTLERS